MISRVPFIIALLTTPLAGVLVSEEDVSPDQIEFRRQAAQRMVFDRSQAIPLALMHPDKVIDFDLMHPELGGEGDGETGIDWKISDGSLVARSGDQGGESLRWVGGFNPFATYDLDLVRIEGTGSGGIVFRDSASGDHLTARLFFREGKPEVVRWKVVLENSVVMEEEWPVPEGLASENLVLRAQMAAVGVNLLVEASGRSFLVGYSDFSEHLDLRKRSLMQRFDFGILADLESDAELTLGGALSALSPGSGQADIRAMTDEEGRPLLDEGRLWFTITVRGRALPHPLQGVFSLNPSVFDLRFEGIIVFDMDDGLLRNELASHLFRDSASGEWRGWTTGFSALGKAGRNEEKTILAVSSTRDPRRGFSVMKARPVGIDGAHEDPHGVYDRKAGKWRLLLCERHEKYQAGMWESEQWDRGYERIAGPVEMDSTGTMIQEIGGTRYALYGSADRKVYVRTYPDLEPAGELSLYLPPWDDRHGTRIWPNVIPLPEGYPAPFVALMMDRVNFPGMPKRNWTYGALYLYHGHVR